MPNTSAYDQLNGWLYTRGTQVTGQQAEQLTGVQGNMSNGDTSVLQVGPLIRLDANQGIRVGPNCDPIYGGGVIKEVLTPFHMDLAGNIRSVRMIRFAAPSEAGDEPDLDGFDATTYIRREDAQNSLVYNASAGIWNTKHEFRAGEEQLFSIGSDQATYLGWSRTGASGVAENMYDVALDDGDAVGIVLTWLALESKSSDRQSRTGMTMISAVRHTDGTLTSTITEFATNAATTTGTLTGTWSVVDNGTSITLALTATTSIASPNSIRLVANIQSLNSRSTGGAITPYI